MMRTSKIEAIIGQVRAMRHQGMTWRAINEALGFPYLTSNNLSSSYNQYYKRGAGRIRKVQRSACFDTTMNIISMEWANAPPAGAETWTDAQWETAIEHEAERRLLGKETHHGAVDTQEP